MSVGGHALLDTPLLSDFTCRLEDAGGCFRRDLFNDRDNLSTDSSDSSSTEDLSIVREGE